MNVEKVRAEIAKMRSGLESIESMLGEEAGEESADISSESEGVQAAGSNVEKSGKKSALAAMLKKKSY